MSRQTLLIASQRVRSDDTCDTVGRNIQNSRYDYDVRFGQAR
jgi:hypothetical protein